MVFVLKKGKALSKGEIVSVVKENLPLLDKGLKLIGEETGPADNRMWDLIGVNEDKMLVLVSIQPEFTDNLLYGILKGLDWAWQHRDILSKMYSSMDIEKNQLPVIFLLAPDFTSQFKKILTRFVNIRIKLIKFISVENKDDKGIIFEPVAIQEMNEGTDKSVSGDNQYIELSPITEITDEELREFFEEQ